MGGRVTASLMADIKQPGQPPEAELVLIERVGAWDRISLDDGTQITVSHDELLALLTGHVKEEAA